MKIINGELHKFLYKTVEPTRGIENKRVKFFWNGDKLADAVVEGV